MCLPAKSSLIRRAIGLSLTNLVRTLTGKPRYDEILATFVSALVACIVKVSLQWTGCPSFGVILIPMLVGTSKAHLHSLRNLIIVLPLHNFYLTNNISLTTIISISIKIKAIFYPVDLNLWRKN
jgi:hypothetical protein